MRDERLADNWRRRYWRFRRWLANAEDLGYPELTGFIHNGLAHTRRHFSERQATDPKFDVPVDFERETYEVAAFLDEARWQKGPKENVYQAALSLGEEAFTHHHTRVLFRGEITTEYSWNKRCFTPRIYRDLPESPSLSESLKFRRHRIDLAAHSLRHIISDFEYKPLEVLAILQHYGVPTWLLDVTTSPLVALFFASHNATSGKIGIVYRWSITEMRDYRKALPELVPEITVIRPAFVSNIDRQFGAFLQAGVGTSIFNMLAFPVLMFKQVEGLAFEDRLLGISSEQLLESDSPIARTLKEAQNLNFWEMDISLSPGTGTPWTFREVTDAPILGVGLPPWRASRDDVVSCTKRLLVRWANDSPDVGAAAECLADVHEATCQFSPRLGSVLFLRATAESLGVVLGEPTALPRNLNHIFSSYLNSAGEDYLWMLEAIRKSLRTHGLLGRVAN